MAKGGVPTETSYNIAILQSLEVLQQSINNLQIEQELCHKRLDRLDRDRSRNSPQPSGLQDPPFSPSFGRHDHTVVPPEIDSGGSNPNVDYQRDFEVIRDSLVKVKLPSDLKLIDSKSGIKRPDQAHLGTISKCARYTENSLKLLASLAERVIDRNPELGKLYTVLVAQMNYLQSQIRRISG